MQTNPQLEAMRAAHFAATGRDLYVDVPLSNVALDYRPEKGIADMVMPIVPVTKQSGFVTEYFRKDKLRVERTRRAPGTEANKVARDVGSKQYFCHNYALKTGVVVEDMANADPIHRAKLINGGAQFVTDKLWLDWEKRVAALAFNTANVGSSSAVASAWNGAGNPLGNVNAAIDNVRNLTGMHPNRILFGEDAWKAFRRDSTVRNLIFGTNNGGGYPSVEQVKNLLEVEQVLIGRGHYNSANEAAAEVLVPLWIDNVLVYFAPNAPSLDSPSWGYSYRWNVPGVPSMQAERHPYDTKTKSQEVEVGYYQDERVTGSEYGFLIRAVNSSS